MDDLDPIWREAIARAYSANARTTFGRWAGVGFLAAGLGLVVGAIIFVYRSHYYTVLSLWDVTAAALCVVAPLVFALEGTVTAAAATASDGILATSQGYAILRGRLVRIVPRAAVAKQGIEDVEIPRYVNAQGGIEYGVRTAREQRGEWMTKATSENQSHLTLELTGGQRLKFGPIRTFGPLDLGPAPDEVAPIPQPKLLADPMVRIVVGAAVAFLLSMLIALPIQRLRNVGEFEQRGQMLLCKYDPPGNCADSAIPHEGEKKYGSTVEYAYFVRDWTPEFPRARLLAVAQKRYVAMLERDIARDWARLAADEFAEERFKLRNLLIERDQAAGDAKYGDLTGNAVEIQVLVTYVRTHPPR